MDPYYVGYQMPQVHMAYLGLVQTYLKAGLQSGTLRHVDAFAHVLNVNPSHYMNHTWMTGAMNFWVNNAVIVPLDSEWYESNKSFITELGIAALSVYSAQHLQANQRKLVDTLKDMDFYHMRIIENAHMINGRRCVGHPEQFQFGPTGFVTKEEGRAALRAQFDRVDFWDNVRPIILLDHSIDNDIKQFKDHFDIDFEQFPILMRLDTQKMAKEVGIEPQRLISLKDLLGRYEVKEEYLHNAANDAAYTMIAACLLANDLGTGVGRSNKQNRTDVDALKVIIRNRNITVYGTPRYCLRCDSKDHLENACPVEVWCPRCVVYYPDQANKHTPEKCLVVASPCEPCSKSPNPKWSQHADTHVTADCQFAPTTNGNNGPWVPPPH